ncbi:MAG: nucleotide exchange factor GrpE [Pseudomonadota bacterium]
MAEIPHDQYPAGICVDVVQTGFIIGDRLLRPAMVTVSKGPGADAGKPSVDTTV